VKNNLRESKHPDRCLSKSVEDMLLLLDSFSEAFKEPLRAHIVMLFEGNLVNRLFSQYWAFGSRLFGVLCYGVFRRGGGVGIAG
jgi:hypothetical protein